jgi:uncharacterized protein
MMQSDAMIFAGRVVHKRLRPKRHGLSYRVFTLLLDVDQLDAVARRCRLFSRNRFNVFSFHDKDHGPGDGTAIKDVAVQCLLNAGRPFENRRIFLLTYPRVFGYVFSPLSVFYVYAPDGGLETLIYEVNNTFGERTSYVVAAGEIASGGVYAQACTKEMHVSPFASGVGGYKFRVIDPGREAVVAVLLSDADGALIKTHFRGASETLNDRALAGLLVRYPLFTLKVIAAIHYEALKLWLKGVPLFDRHISPRYSSIPTQTAKQG